MYQCAAILLAFAIINVPAGLKALDLQLLISSTPCGTFLQIPHGTYHQPVEVSASCPDDAPLILDGGAAGNVTLRAALTVSGQNIHLYRLQFEGIEAKAIISGSYIKVIASSFSGFGHPAAIMMQGGGAHAEIAYNHFFRPAAWLPDEIDGTDDYPLRIGIRSGHRQENFFAKAWVHHNLFQDFPAKPVNPVKPGDYHDGQSDAIEVCASESDLRADWRVEFNIVDRHQQGHGVIDIKCSGNYVAYNWLRDSHGRIDLRFGDYNHLIGNRLEQRGGARIRGKGHHIEGNIFAGGSRLELMAGVLPDNGRRRGKPAATDSFVYNNSGALVIGQTDRLPPERLAPATDNQIMCHHGPVENGMSSQNLIEQQCRKELSLVSKADKIPTPDQVGPQGFSKLAHCRQEQFIYPCR